MGTTKKKLSIDEFARRLRNEILAKIFGVNSRKAWRSNPDREEWHRVARLARKLEAQPAAKKPKPLVCEACGKSKRSVRRRTDWRWKMFYSCELCWYHMAGDEFDQRVAARRAKAAAKKARK